jgi:hypothetical protein
LRGALDDLVFNVKTYGAVGDGTTQEQVAVQAAINAANAAGGGIIFFPRGTYLFHESIELKDNCTLRGVGVGTVFTTDMFPSAKRGIVKVSNKNYCTIEHIKFSVNSSVNGSVNAITSYGSIGLTIRNNYFTGNTNTGFHGMVFLNGQEGTNPIRNTVIENNHFENITNITSINLYAGATNTISDTRIVNNYFKDVLASVIYLDAYGLNRDTLVSHNQFIDIIGSALIYATAVKTRLSNDYNVKDLTISNNQYRNTRTSQRMGFAFTYSCQDTVISNNTCVVPVGSEGPCFAPGRTDQPNIGLQILGNWVEGFDAFWDPDSKRFVEVANNIVYCCGAGIGTGYGTQEYLDVHDNIIYNSVGVYPGAFALGGATPVKSKIHDNLVIDDRNPSTATSAFIFTGNSNYADLEIYNNRIYVPHRALTMIVKDGGSEVLPRKMEGNEVHDLNGITLESAKYAQGNVTGATTFNRANGPIITATLTGNITVILTDGTRIGELLELRLTQDGTGSRTVTWPSNFKKAGGSLTLSTAAGAKDLITARWDGTNWVEVSRALNVS